MARQFWTEAELEDLPRLTYDEFRGKYPHRSYDSWEVKRRRIAGGTSGIQQSILNLKALLTFKALMEYQEKSLDVMEDYLESTGGYATDG